MRRLDRKGTLSKRLSHTTTLKDVTFLREVSNYSLLLLQAAIVQTTDCMGRCLLIERDDSLGESFHFYLCILYDKTKLLKNDAEYYMQSYMY